MIDVNGDLALINPTKPIVKEEFGRDPKEGYVKNLRPTLKLVAPIQACHSHYGIEAFKHRRNSAVATSQPHLRLTRQFKPQEV